MVVPVFLWVDRMEAEPVRYLIFAFLWGALCAAVGAIILNTGIHLIFLAAHTDNADAVTAVVSAPVVEETLKGAAILFIAWRRRREFDGVIDGIVYAGMAGAGFAFSENILYLGRAFAEAGTSGLTEVFFLRCLMGPFAHPLFTACTGIGIGLAATVARSAAARIAYGTAGLVAAMGLHAIWNLSASVGAYLQVYLAFQMPIFAVFLVGLVLLRQREAGWCGATCRSTPMLVGSPELRSRCCPRWGNAGRRARGPAVWGDGRRCGRCAPSRTVPVTSPCCGLGSCGVRPSPAPASTSAICWTP